MCAGVLDRESSGVAVDQDLPQSDHPDFGVARPTLLTASLPLAFNGLGKLSAQDDSRHHGSTKLLVDKGRRPSSTSRTDDDQLRSSPMLKNSQNWSIDGPVDDPHRSGPPKDVLNGSGTIFTLRGLGDLGRLTLHLLSTVALLCVLFAVNSS